MKKLMSYCLFCFILIALSCKSQNEFNKLIIGGWKGVGMETFNGHKLNPSGEPYKNCDAYYFKKNGILVNYDLLPTIDSSCNYSIKNDDLTICNTNHFIIEKLNEKEMVIREFNGKNRNSGGFRYTFIKVENREELIKFETAIYYPTIKEKDRKDTISELKKKQIISDTTVLSVVDKMPEFPNGYDAMKNFIKKNLNITNLCKGKGSVYLSIIVEKNGEITNIKVLQSLLPDCDKEAIRVIKLMPKWIPGEQNGKKERVMFLIPINF